MGETSEAETDQGAAACSSTKVQTSTTLKNHSYVFGKYRPRSMLQFQQLCDETLSWINEKDQTLSTEDCGRDLPSVQALQRKHMVSITASNLTLSEDNNVQ